MHLHVVNYCYYRYIQGMNSCMAADWYLCANNLYWGSRHALILNQIIFLFYATRDQWQRSLPHVVTVTSHFLQCAMAAQEIIINNMHVCTL